MRKLEKPMNKKNNGITLIALVITIIVLLILAGVTIATIAGDNGILIRAKDASRETEIASVKEQAQLDISNWIAEELENGRKGIINDWKDIKSILDTANSDTANRYYKNVTEEGVETPNGYIVPIEELYRNSSNGEETTAKTVEDLIAGNRVYYNTGNTSVGNQGVIKCVVLYDSSSEYGVQIIAEDTVDVVTLGDSDFNTSMNLYNTAITTLNAKAEEYQNATYVSDARCVGSVPNNKNAEPENFKGEYSYLSLYTFRDADTNYETDYNQMGTLDILIANANYWLASRHIVSGSSNSNLYVRHVNTSGKANYTTLCNIFSSGRTHGTSNLYGFRPVFTLNSGIKLIEGDGNTIPYTLGV